MWGNKWWSHLCSQVHSAGLVSADKGNRDLFDNGPIIYWILVYPTLCHLLYALPHCTFKWMLEIGTDIISAYRGGIQAWWWSNLLSIILQRVSGGPGSHTQLCVYRALVHTAFPEIVICSGESRCGCVWGEPSTMSSSSLHGFLSLLWSSFLSPRPQKASSPLSVGFRMWFPSFSSPPRSKIPLFADNLLCWSPSEHKLCV